MRANLRHDLLATSPSYSPSPHTQSNIDMQRAYVRRSSNLQPNREPRPEIPQTQTLAVSNLGCISPVTRQSLQLTPKRQGKRLQGPNDQSCDCSCLSVSLSLTTKLLYALVGFVASFVFGGSGKLSFLLIQSHRDFVAQARVTTAPGSRVCVHVICACRSDRVLYVPEDRVCRSNRPELFKTFFCLGGEIYMYIPFHRRGT